MCTHFCLCAFVILAPSAIAFAWLLWRAGRVDDDGSARSKQRNPPKAFKLIEQAQRSPVVAGHTPTQFLSKLSCGLPASSPLPYLSVTF